jgi:predicted DNA-binding transcriptional regulator AlpA
MRVAMAEVRKMLTWEGVLKIVPASRSTLERMERDSRFPMGRLLNGKKVWFEDEIADWASTLPTGRRQYSSRRKKG